MLEAGPIESTRFSIRPFVWDPASAMFAAKVLRRDFFSDRADAGVSAPLRDLKYEDFWVSPEESDTDPVNDLSM